VIRDVTDDDLLAALDDTWASADRIQRSLRRGLFDHEAPTIITVGRRLSRLAREGRCEKSHGDGAGLYRRLP
jgi:hypothetical protein